MNVYVYVPRIGPVPPFFSVMYPTESRLQPGVKRHRQFRLFDLLVEAGDDDRDFGESQEHREQQVAQEVQHAQHDREIEAVPVLGVDFPLEEGIGDGRVANPRVYAVHTVTRHGDVHVQHDQDEVTCILDGLDVPQQRFVAGDRASELEDLSHFDREHLA